jgi:hypothetical protein
MGEIIITSMLHRYVQSLWQESLNSDGKQFLQYQQKEQPPLTLNHGTQKFGRVKPNSCVFI